MDLKAPRQTLRFLVILMVLLLGGGSVSCGRDTSGDATNRNVVAKDGRVRFKLWQTEFDIPRKYFKGAAETAGGIAETALLWALLPDFEGYDEAVNHHEFVEVLGHGRRLRIMLIVRGRRMTVPQIVEKRRRTPRVDVLGRHQGKYDEIRFGMEYYRPHLQRKDAVYLYQKEGTPVLLLDCAEDPRIPSPACRGVWDYNDQVAVQFTFSTRFLPQWREILTGIEALLNGKLDCCTPKAEMSVMTGE